MTRHRRFLRPLGAENDPKVSKESVDSNEKGKTTDLYISDDIIGSVTPRAPLRRSKRTKIATESVESQDKGKTNDLPVSDDITGPVKKRAPLRRSKRAEITKGSVGSRDGEIAIGSPNLADHREQLDTSKNPLRCSTWTSKPTVQFEQSRPKQAIKRVKIKMGKEQSKPTQEEMDKCQAKVESLEELLTHYKDDDRTSMESIYISSISDHTFCYSYTTISSLLLGI